MVLTSRVGHKASTGKTATWLGCLKNAHLPTHLAWKAYHFQLWPGIRYGITTLDTSIKEVDNLLHKLEFKMISCLGVNQRVKMEWRKLARKFGGIGLFNLAIKQFISWLKVLLQHYGADFTTSQKLQASLEATQLEIGCRGNPLNKIMTSWESWQHTDGPRWYWSAPLTTAAQSLWTSQKRQYFEKEITTWWTFFWKVARVATSSLA
jgi:hypothetical protein